MGLHRVRGRWVGGRDPLESHRLLHIPPSFPVRPFVPALEPFLLVLPFSPTSVRHVLQICPFLPVLRALAVLLRWGGSGAGIQAQARERPIRPHVSPRNRPPKLERGKEVRESSRAAIPAKTRCCCWNHNVRTRTTRRTQMLRGAPVSGAFAPRRPPEGVGPRKW
ncbi:hypothetical protein ADL25_03470 [Streptomyces sp. NRRL F-5122]|nr:hypothetical protein ADL25_03470 [Streptomyces sp. NRRL F-5122]